jgi:NAD(P)-dependent dehydrogenase (short-subunit alcohol dehydrogenase family)
MDLTNASAIVTGGAGGFGSATVRRLAQKGAKVVIADVSDERGEALAREVGSLYVSTDCMDEDAIAKAVKAAAATVAEGLEEIAHAEGPFDVAIVDLMLPDGDGTDVVREIKASYPETLVAVLSSVRDLSGALRAGADEALGKAVPLPEIVSSLADLAATGRLRPVAELPRNPYTRSSRNSG